MFGLSWDTENRAENRCAKNQAAEKHNQKRKGAQRIVGEEGKHKGKHITTLQQPWCSTDLEGRAV